MPGPGPAPKRSRHVLANCVGIHNLGSCLADWEADAIELRHVIFTGLGTLEERSSLIPGVHPQNADLVPLYTVIGWRTRL